MPSDWALEYTKLKLGELFSKYPTIHVKGYLDRKKVEGMHILIGGFMEPNFSPFSNIFDSSSNAFRHWGNGDEVMEGITYNNAAITLNPKATGIVQCNMPSRGCIASVFANERQQSLVVAPISRICHDQLRKSMESSQLFKAVVFWKTCKR